LRRSGFRQTLRRRFRAFAGVFFAENRGRLLSRISAIFGDKTDFLRDRCFRDRLFSPFPFFPDMIAAMLFRLFSPFMLIE